MHIEEFLCKFYRNNTNKPPKVAVAMLPSPTDFHRLRLPIQGYAPLVKGFEDFWIRRFYGRIADCYNRPITGKPGAEITVLDRKKVENDYE